jgi:PTH1 family peptidyl-tRNA hydrolase
MCAFRRVKAALGGLVSRAEPAAPVGPSRVVVGLGNPGPGYARHRHNLGFMVVDRFAERHGLRFGRGQGNALVAVGTYAGDPIVLAKPQSFMNLSGAPVRAVLRKYGRGPADLTVVYDDLDLPLGRVRIRKGGGHGGHNGMRDLLATLDSGDFARVRIGIGRPPSGDDVVDHVLRPFTPDERPVIERAVDDAVAALEAILSIGLDNAMNQFNRDPRAVPVPAAGRPAPAPSTDATAPVRASRSKAAPTALAPSGPDEAAD